MRKTLAALAAAFMLAAGLSVISAPAQATDKPTGCFDPKGFPTPCPTPVCYDAKGLVIPCTPCLISVRSAVDPWREEALAGRLTITAQQATISAQRARIAHQRVVIKRLRHRLATR